jgi:gamma-D-glutamyl-L-lysine dipeptidyl-peptidase
MADVQQMTVRRAVAPLLGEPRISTSLTSQLLAGDVVTVIDGRGDWLQVRGADGYEGWTHTGYLAPSDGSEAGWRLSMGCTVRDAHGQLMALPLGARVAHDAVVERGQVIDAAACAERFPLTRSHVVDSASTLYSGASYQWGGVSPWGCDCSGFVQRIFAFHGLQLPRDAWQQAIIGYRTGAAADDLHEPADLLFFSDRDDRRITHVGMALGGDRMVHSALMRGGIAIESLRDGDGYVARLRAQCVDVRRVIG